MEELELLCLQVITNAGEARSEAMAAMDAAENGQFEQAKAHLDAAAEKRKAAHHVHTQLITMDAGGELEKISLILVHSEDIMMSAELTYSLVEKMLRMYQKLWEVTGTL